MNYSQEFTFYSAQIRSLADHAKAIGFNLEEGRIEDLINSWIERQSLLNKVIEENKENVITLLQRMTK